MMRVIHSEERMGEGGGGGGGGDEADSIEPVVHTEDTMPSLRDKTTPVW